jgi:hypothetical protein
MTPTAFFSLLKLRARISNKKLYLLFLSSKSEQVSQTISHFIQMYLPIVPPLFAAGLRRAQPCRSRSHEKLKLITLFRKR